LNEVTKELNALPPTAEKEALDDIEKPLLEMKTDLANITLAMQDEAEKDKKRLIKPEELKAFEKKTLATTKNVDPEDEDKSVSAMAKQLVAEKTADDKARQTLASKKNLDNFDRKQDEFIQKQQNEFRRAESLKRVEETKKVPTLAGGSSSSTGPERLKNLSKAKGTKSASKLNA